MCAGRPPSDLAETSVQLGMSMFVAFGLRIIIVYLLSMVAIVAVVCSLHLHVLMPMAFFYGCF